MSITLSRCIKTAVILAVFIAPTAIANPHVVGSTPANFSVSGGQAHYTIPIQVTPGRGGMQPDLSLNYTGGGHGVLGMGWSVGGLSSIHRCAATIEQEGYAGRITFTDKDRYCLDGQRLIPINGGNNGAVGTEYRTEINNYAQIKSYGGGVNNPSYFIVKTKAGQVMTFGGGNASLVFSQGTSAWSIREINDSTGNNPVTYHYFIDQNTQYLDKVTYTNGRVDMVYAPNNSLSIRYFLGHEIKSLQRLSRITLYGNRLKEKEYTLAYNPTGVNKPSTLKSVQECDDKGVCVDKIHFFWETASNGNFTHWTNQSTARGSSGRYSHYFADVNGDGMADWIQVDKLHHKGWVGLATGDGNFTHWTNESTARGSSSGLYTHYVANVNDDGIQEDKLSQNSSIGLITNDSNVSSLTNQSSARGSLLTNQSTARVSSGRYTHYFADVNGDGMADWIQVDTLHHKGWVGLATGDGNFTHWTNQSTARGSSGRYSHYFADVNGDGMDDWIQVDKLHAKGWVGLATGDGNFTHWTNYSSARGPSEHYSHYFADVNGDGMADWIQVSKSNNYGWVGLATGDGNFAHWTNQTEARGASERYSHYFADVNGDGMADWIQVDKLHPKGWVGLATGDGNFAHWTNQSLERGASGRYSHYFTDVNGDGMADWIQVDKLHNNSWTGLAKGNGDFEHWTHRSSETGAAERYTHYFADVNGDGMSDWIQVDKNAHHGSVGLANKGRTAITAIVDSNANTTELTYLPLTDPSVYTKGTGAEYPVQDLQYPGYVVSSVKTSNGIAETRTVNYHYEGLKAHVRGRGSYGYAKITETYPDTGKSKETTFTQTGFPLTGNVDQVVEKYNGQVINTSNNTVTVRQTHPGVYALHLNQSTDKSYELNGDLITTVTTTQSNIDRYGNIGTLTIETYGNGKRFSKTVQSRYHNDTTNWYLGRLTYTTVTHKAPGQPDQQRRSTFGYDSHTGLLTTEAIISTVTGLPLTTTRTTYDAYGHKTQVTVSATGETARTTTNAYTSEGRLRQTCNSLGQCDTYTYSPEGWLASATDPNGLTTLWHYDGFGRKIAETRADGTKTWIFRHIGPSTNLCGVLATHAYTCRTSRSTGSGLTIVQYGRLGRVQRRIARGFDGRWIYSDTEYNSLGQVTRISRPYFSGDELYWANSEYDALGRVTRMDEPAPHGTRNVITTTYNGLTTTVTAGPEQRQKITTTNAIGQVIHREEEEGSTIDYTYNADGNLHTTTVADDSDTTITLRYDEFGRKISMDDPDMGQWSYRYNAFGQLISQSDAKRQTTTMGYDLVGRLVSRTEAEGTSTWVYGDHTVPKGSIGKLLSATTAGISKTYLYDSLGRPDEVNTRIVDAGSAGEQSFSTQTLYDSSGRVSRTLYPGSDNFYTENIYNPSGFLEKVQGLRSNSEHYDLRQLTPLVAKAVTLAETYLQKAKSLKAIGKNYKDALFFFQRQPGEKNTQLPEPPSGVKEAIKNTLVDHQRVLRDTLTSVTYEHRNNTLLELAAIRTLLVSIDRQVHAYEEMVERLIVLAEQSLAAADNRFQYQRTLSRGANAYTEMVNDNEHTTYWRALDVDASGRISAEVYGNGITNDSTYNQGTGQLQQRHSSLLTIDPIRHLEYQYDAYQNVTRREDHAHDIREFYEYDRLDRLTRHDIVSSLYLSTDFKGNQIQRYDALGNITHKSDVGAYTYGNTARPHAVTAAGTATYQYDANGNMTRGDSRTVTWSSFNKPTVITQGNTSVAFAYDPSRARYKKTNHLGHTTLYVGSLYEKLTQGAGTATPSTEEKHYIYAAGELVAEHIVSTSAGVQTRYLHKDALGSVDLITDATGNVVDRRSFDAWGKLRNLTWQDTEGLNNPLYITQLPFTNKGYTGHETLQEVGLIHMNGRVYDARLARFMSADPHIQSPYKSQSYNRYSYVMNNPMKYTDPSGYYYHNDDNPHDPYSSSYTGCSGCGGSSGGGSDSDGTGTPAPTPKEGNSNPEKKQSWFSNTWLGQQLGTLDRYNQRWANGYALKYGIDTFARHYGDTHSSYFLGALEHVITANAMLHSFKQINGGFKNVNAEAAQGLALGWGAAVAEPTPFGEIVMGLITGGAVLYYGPELMEKMTKEISGIMENAMGPQGVQYSLRTTAAGSYLCVNCASGAINLGVDEVWKYGETIHPNTRYSQKFFRSSKLRQANEFFGNQMQIKVIEKMKIYNHFMINGRLPPGNKIFR